MAQRMAFEGLCYIGAAGSTATTRLTQIVKEVSMPDSIESVEVTTKQETIKTYMYGEEEFSISFGLANDDSNAALATILAAKAARNYLAFRGVDRSAGLGPDMDCMIAKCELMQPKGKNQVWDIELKPTNAAGREPQIYV